MGLCACWEMKSRMNCRSAASAGSVFVTTSYLLAGNVAE
jgi:hypothetical protein